MLDKCEKKSDGVFLQYRKQSWFVDCGSIIVFFGDASMQLDRQFLSGVSCDFSILYDKEITQPSFSIDTRTLQPGDIFIALAGNTVDGHSFIAQAFEKGASGCIISDGKKDLLQKIDIKILQNKLIITTLDTLEALYAIAKTWREQFTYPVVAVTGSIGKTTTKELISHILHTNKTSHLVSYSNYNTAIGVAITIMNMRADHLVYIQEVGISKRGEMKTIVEMLQPTTSVITNVCHQHMDGLGSLQDIAEEKRKIFSLFTEKNIGIINGDQPLLTNVSYVHPVIRFGLKTTNQIQARKVIVSDDQTRFILKIYKNKYDILIKQSHESAIANILSATAIAYLLNVPDDVIVDAVKQKIVVSGRFEQRQIANNKGILIDDAYNANPESMKAALLAFQHIKTDAPKIAVIGDMLGLGVSSPFWHRQIGRFLRKVPSLKKIILVGDFVSWTKKTAPVSVETEMVKDWQEAVRVVENELVNEPLVLVKGSHAIGLHNLVEKFCLER